MNSPRLRRTPLAHLNDSLYMAIWKSGSTDFPDSVFIFIVVRTLPLEPALNIWYNLQ